MDKDINENKDKELISVLKFIGKIGKDEKLNVKDMSIQPNNYITSLIRSFIQYDNRNNTFELIKPLNTTAHARELFLRAFSSFCN